MITLHPASTALVLIDLQQGIVAMKTAPRPASGVVQASRQLSAKFRARQAPVVWVNVDWAADYADAPPGLTDVVPTRRKGGLPPGWADLVEDLAEPDDLRVTKHQWGAFTGTDLDLQLRRRGIDTIVLGGIATHMGVESTARHAWELGYHVVVVEDACAGPSAELHAASFTHVFPHIARVASLRSLRWRATG